VSVEALRFDKATWTAGLKPLCDMWSALYPRAAFEGLVVAPAQLNAADPVAAFVYMEVAAVKEVLQAVHESIATITSVLQGTAMLTATSQEEATALLRGAVPGSWSARWEGPEAPTAWVSLVTKKAAALLLWAERVGKQALLRGAVDLSELFHPETFLSALRQRSARSLGIAIDELKLVSSFERAKVAGETTVELEGLCLQGCEFDGRRLVDIRDGGAGSRELILLPPCFIAWVGSGEPDPYPAEATVRTPIYHALDREELLCTIEAPNQGEAATRVLGGVALFLAGAGGVE
jgi:dynein heavy chain 2, cytosolic